MALTTTNVVQAPGAPTTTKPPAKSPFRAVLGWTAVAGAVAASGVLAVLALTPDRGSSMIDTGRVVAEYGSIRAIEHRDDLAVQRREAMTRTVAEYGSVSAIEHRDLAVQPGEAMSRTVAEHGSISAIEHRDDLAVPRREAMSHTVAEHGTISAIEHRDLAVQPGEAMSHTVAEHGSISAIEHRDDLAAVATLAQGGPETHLCAGR
jgi:hypothetical protein